MCIYGNCALWGRLFCSCILEEIGILKGDQKGVKDWMTLTVTHWLLHHRVTVEFRGSMGKFVQLSTQIRTYRNCRGGGGGGGGALCVSHSINSCYCAGGIPGAEGETPPCILHRAELIPPAEQTSSWPESIHPLSVFLQGGPPSPTSELKEIKIKHNGYISQII